MRIDITNIQDLKEELNDKQDFYVFGAGRFCYALLKTIACEGHYSQIKGIVVSDKNNNPDIIMGVEVRAIDDIGSQKNKEKIIVAIFEKNHDEVWEKIKELFNEILFLHDNLFRELVENKGDFSIDIFNNTQRIRDYLNRTNYWNNEKFNYLVHEINEKYECIRKQYYETNEKYEYIRKQLLCEINAAQEIVWSNNFNNLILSSDWITQRDFSTNGYAVGSYYLFILYKVLDSGAVNNILDVGMGQTSKLITQYVVEHSNVKHTIVEADDAWIDFFGRNITPSSKIIKLDYEMIDFEGDIVRTYKGFKEQFERDSFDLISIDAPYGSDMKNKSRIDILSIIPKCLSKSFIIMIDDVDRIGEDYTFTKIQEILDANNIEFVAAKHSGLKTFGIITSVDNKYFSYC